MSYSVHIRMGHDIDRDCVTFRRVEDRPGNAMAQFEAEVTRIVAEKVERLTARVAELEAARDKATGHIGSCGDRSGTGGAMTPEQKSRLETLAYMFSSAGGGDPEDASDAAAIRAALDLGQRLRHERDAVIGLLVQASAAVHPPGLYDVLLPDKMSPLGFSWEQDLKREAAVALVRKAAGLDTEEPRHG